MRIDDARLRTFQRTSQSPNPFPLGINLLPRKPPKRDAEFSASNADDILESPSLTLILRDDPFPHAGVRHAPRSTEPVREVTAAHA